MSERFGWAPLSEIFSYEPGWPVMSERRRREAAGLIGAGRLA